VASFVGGREYIVGAWKKGVQENICIEFGPRTEVSMAERCMGFSDQMTALK
jgi:hypothetical protein